MSNAQIRGRHPDSLAREDPALIIRSFPASFHACFRKEGRTKASGSSGNSIWLCAVLSVSRAAQLLRGFSQVFIVVFERKGEHKHLKGHSQFGSVSRSLLRAAHPREGILRDWCLTLVVNDASLPILVIFHHFFRSDSEEEVSRSSSRIKFGSPCRAISLSPPPSTRRTPLATGHPSRPARLTLALDDASPSCVASGFYLGRRKNGICRTSGGRLQRLLLAELRS